MGRIVYDEEEVNSAMKGTYDLSLVLLSLAVAILSSYTSLDLATRISLIDAGAKRYKWLVGGAFALGLGIWSMHFIGMLALQMPMAVSYNPWITAASLLLAICISYLALLTMTRAQTKGYLALSGILVGIGVAGMHYSGMAAMQMRPAIHYRLPLLLLSIGVAIVFSWAALWIALKLDEDELQHVIVKRCVASLFLGLAIAGMHYTGMSAAELPDGAVSGAYKGITTNSLFMMVCVFSMFGLVMTLVLSTLETRFDRLVLQSDRSIEDAQERLRTLATIDTLTGVPNRNSFMERVNRRLATVDGLAAFSVIFLDLDGFKSTNDLLGHAAGDELLRTFATELLSCIRAEDMVARLGGDEFVILLEGHREPESIAFVANAILDRTQRDFFIHGTSLRITASMGIATFPQDGSSVSTLLRHADTAMYEAKQQGKSTFRVFHPAMTATAGRVLTIHRGLSEAIEKKQFSLAFQAKFGGSQNKLVGAEALIRWKHPELGELPPLDFIGIAEQTGHIGKISEWVIAEACRQMKRWAQLGLPPLKVAINLSPEQLRQEHYVARVSEIIAEFGIKPNQIMFEVTERVAMREPAMAGEVIRQFQAAGFEIALDDFGVGYSSMAYLQQFRVKQLKIDRLFVVGLDQDGEENQAIVAAIIALAHSLRMTVVAEGVETMTQLQKLLELGCDELQGYLLARPLEARHFESFLREQAKRESSLSHALHTPASLVLVESAPTL